MSERKVLVLGLDGVDIELAQPMLDAGELPALQALRERGASFLLDHGAATRTGLAWEHYASGMGPETAQRSSVVELLDYDTIQRGSKFAPSFGAFDAQVVVFDPPYTDLSRASNYTGIVGWGAHDAGVACASVPASLRSELMARNEVYPATEWLYASPWPSVGATTTMSRSLVDAVDMRRETARWLLTERLPDWNLAIVVTGEAHTAAEAFWHGVDDAHPLHAHPSARVAARGIAELYRAIDRMVGELIEQTEPSAVVAFSMGGMGTNNSDIPSMVLLPELVYRWSTDEPLLRVPDEWAAAPTVAPILADGDSWGAAIRRCYGPSGKTWRSRVKAVVPKPARRALRQLRPLPTSKSNDSPNQSLEWMPPTWYRSHWSTMRAFALPSFYDGRIRINLVGREASGIVTLDEYADVLQELEELLAACRNPATGEPVVRAFARAPGDPFALTASDADLTIEWGATTSAFDHPDLGCIGPIPYRRTGGHTGPHGFAFLAGDGIAAGDGGVRSAFDVNPTVAELLGFEPLPGLDGSSLLGARV